MLLPKSSLVGSFTVFLLFSHALAQNEWTGEGEDNLWSNPENWSYGEVPAGERVKINGPWADESNGPVIQDGIDAVAEVLISDAGEASMSMTGGSLELIGWGAWWGDAANSTASFLMSGGEVLFTGGPGIMELGWQEPTDPVGSSVGIWEMSGGEIFAQGVDMPGKGNGGIGQIYLMGGTINVGTSRGGLVLYEGALIDITGGELILEGEQIQVEEYIENGWIVGYGGAGEVIVDYGDDFTTVVATGGLKGDFNRNGELDSGDIDLLSAEVKSMTNDTAFDLNDDKLVNQVDRTVWVHELKKTWMGDADLSGEFNSGDFVVIFQAGEYEDNEQGNSKWSTGDFNGDTEFDSGDFVAAFQDGGYERGPRVAVVVPEPSSVQLFLLGVAALLARKRT